MQLFRDRRALSNACSMLYASSSLCISLCLSVGTNAYKIADALQKLLNQLGSINNNEMKNLLHGNMGSSGHGRATSSSSSSSSRSAVHNQYDHEQQKVPRSELVTQSRESGVKHGPHLPKDGEALRVGSGHGNALDDKEVARIKKEIKHAARLVDEERHQMQEEKWHMANAKQRQRNGDNGQKEKEEEAQKQQTRQVVEEQREDALQQNDGKTRAADSVQGTAGGATTEVEEVDDFQHPYHPHPDDVGRISQLKSSQSGSTTPSASATNEHYKHAHYPTLFEAVEKKRKDLFRKQELIDHGSVVVISSELYVPHAHAWGSFHEPYRSMHEHVCMLRHECVRACTSTQLLPFRRDGSSP